MYDPRLSILLLALVGAAMSSGCSHERSGSLRPEPGQASLAGETQPGADSIPGQAGPAATSEPLVKPEKDLRYRLPAAQERSLNIFLGSQTFEYVEDGQIFLSGKISSGDSDHPTPKGEFRVLSKDLNKRSGKYTNSFDENTPMPYALQFSGPYFVHEGWVPGYADSHGCVRLHYEDARLLFNRVRLGDRIAVKGQGAARPANPWPDLFPVF